MPPRGKGVPRILRELLDTYIVTSGDSYDLQVWNRSPSARSVLVEYDRGAPLLASDVRFVLVRVHTLTNRIGTIVVLTPDYIVRHFGDFGKPTVKHQLLISAAARARVLAMNPPVLFYPDLPTVARLASPDPDVSHRKMRDEPVPGLVRRLESIRAIVVANLVGSTIEEDATKSRGQALEELVARLLGYQPREDELLAGGYPDLRHQALEVKVQDSPTVDFGQFSPRFEEEVPACPGFTTASIRYLIALTDKGTGAVQGAVVCPGRRLGEHFTFASETNFKCQRAIPMAFSDQFKRRSVFNPQAQPT